MSSGITSFEELGRSLRAAWKSDDFDTERFPSHASRALREFALEAEWSLGDLVQETLSRGVLHQSHPFGDLPVRVYETQEFYAEILVWLDGTTMIHEHGFSGAFQVLAGQSIHSRFAFEPTHRVSRRLHFGAVTLRDAELLTAGDVREIRPGAASMHSLFHLQRPSITLVVRTKGEFWWAPQMTVCRPACAIDDMLLRDPTVVFASRGLKALAGGADDFPAALAQLLRVLDTPRAFALCMTLVEDPLFQGETIREVLRERFALKHTEVIASLEFQGRLQRYMNLRRIIRSTKDRLMLALLATVPSRERVQALAETHFGIDEGRQQIAKMIGTIMERDGFRFGVDETVALESIRLVWDNAGSAGGHEGRDTILAKSGNHERHDLLTRVSDFLHADVLIREFLR